MKYISSRIHSNVYKNFFDVEKIISRKFIGKNRYYLIKWVGYSVKECSWEPVSHLVNVRDMIETFDSNFPNSIDKKELKRYLNMINQRNRHIIRIKNPFFKNKGDNKIKIKKKDDIIICIDNTDVFKNENVEKKEEEKIVDDKEKTELNVGNVNIKEDKNSFNDSENLNKISNTFSSELIRPILIW